MSSLLPSVRMNYAGEQSAVGPLSGGGLRAASGTGDWEQCHSEHPHVCRSGSFTPLSPSHLWFLGGGLLGCTGLCMPPSLRQCILQSDSSIFHFEAMEELIAVHLPQQCLASYTAPVQRVPCALHFACFSKSTALRTEYCFPKSRWVQRSRLA